MPRNVATGSQLLSFIERVERIRESKKQLADDEKLIFAEAKSSGFSTKRIGDVLKIRAMNPHDREEAEAELDMYLHAIGMAKDAPLFRAVGLMAVDTTVREQVIDAVKLLVPPTGEFIVKIGGTPVRIWRDEDGAAHAEDWKEPEPPKRKSQSSGSGYSAPAKSNVPDVDPEGAEDMGREAYKAGTAIIKNPFPWDDPRRARWDTGWRSEGGTDGMGPNEEE